MGFWNDLGDALSKGPEAWGSNPQTWYGMGKVDGEQGNARRTYQFVAQKIDRGLLEAYDRGYDDGRAERMGRR